MPSTLSFVVNDYITYHLETTKLLINSNVNIPFEHNKLPITTNNKRNRLPVSGNMTADMTADQLPPINEIIPSDLMMGFFGTGLSNDKTINGFFSFQPCNESKQGILPI